MNSDPIVIVGAALGGLRTAESIRRTGSSRPIVVIGSERHLPYNRTPLCKDALRDGPDLAALAYPIRDSLDGVDWRLGTPVVGADLERRVVVDGAGRESRYRALVIATGVRARRIGGGSPDLDGRIAMRTIEDAAALHDRLGRGMRVVVAGGGFVGCEIAATAALLGSDVTIVAADRHPLQRALGAELGAGLEARHVAHGVRFVRDTRVVGIEGRARVTGVVLADGRRLPCDVLVEAVGSLPNTEWLRGNDLDLARGVRTDGALRALRGDGTPWPDVVAVGDVARFPHPIFAGGAETIEHWNMPTDTGRRAGRVVATFADDAEALERELDAPFAPMPTFWSDQYDVHLLAFGLPALADSIDRSQGTPDGECVYRYRRGEQLVGVAGIGFRPELQIARHEIAAAWEPVRAGSA